MHILAIRCRSKNTKKLFDIVRASLGLTSEDALRLLCYAYLNNPTEVKVFAETFNGQPRLKVD